VGLGFDGLALVAHGNDDALARERRHSDPRRSLNHDALHRSRLGRGTANQQNRTVPAANAHCGKRRPFEPAASGRRRGKATASMAAL
jgi:hypothetical protein